MKTAFHFIFWVLVHVVLTLVFAGSTWSFVESFYFVSMLLPVVIISCYFFNDYLVPKYLITKKYFLFGLYLIYMLIASFYLESVVIIVSYILLANYNYEKLSPVTADVFVLSFILYAIVLLYSFINLVGLSFSKQSAIEKFENERQKRELGALIVRADRKQVKITYEEIQYIESLADYLKIHLTHQQIVTKEKIGKIEDSLPASFLRIHRSFIINLNKIISFNREVVIINGVELPISRKYKKQTLLALQNKNKEEEL